MEIKGTAVIAIRDFVKSTFPTKYDNWLNSLPETSKAIFSNSIDSTKWYEIEEAAVTPTKEIGKTFYDQNHQQAAWESGRFSAEKGLTGFYKMFVQAASPNFIISRADMVFKRYYRPCVVTTEKKERGVNATFHYEQDSNSLIEYRIAGWMQKALEISGCKHVNIEIVHSHTKGANDTLISCKWD